MKVTLFSCLLLGAACLAVAQAPAAKTAKKPAAHKLVLPERLLSAKTLCVKILAAADADVAEARRELKTWGRFKVVEDCAQAEVALWISARAVPDLKICHTTVQIINNPDSTVLWNGSLGCTTSTKGTVGRLVSKLRHDIAQTAPAKSAPKAAVSGSAGEKPKP